MAIALVLAVAVGSGVLPRCTCGAICELLAAPVKLGVGAVLLLASAPFGAVEGCANLADVQRLSCRRVDLFALAASRGCRRWSLVTGLLRRAWARCLHQGGIRKGGSEGVV